MVKQLKTFFMKQTAIRLLLFVLFLLVFHLWLKYDKPTSVLYSFVTVYILEGAIAAALINKK